MDKRQRIERFILGLDSELARSIYKNTSQSTKDILETILAKRQPSSNTTISRSTQTNVENPIFCPYYDQISYSSYFRHLIATHPWVKGFLKSRYDYSTLKPYHNHGVFCHYCQLEGHRIGECPFRHSPP